MIEFEKQICNERNRMLRLGLDLGTSSIGWALCKIEGSQPTSIVKLGVRIFPDGRQRDGTSLAASRRQARQMRRQRDRRLKRKARLMDTLVAQGFMPGAVADRKKLETLDPYLLRKDGLERKLTAHELGRAIFHLAQRRGFKSNRKVDKGNNESGPMKIAIARTREVLKAEGARTYGEWLYHRRDKGQGVKARPMGKGANKDYELYADRDLIDEELIALWQSQQKFDLPECTAEALKALRDVILFQRKLRPVDPGTCTLEAGEPRAPWASMSTQRFRILQELNNLKIIELDYTSRYLTKDERDRIARELEEKKEFKFEQIAKKLALDPAVRFNLESERRGLIKGNEVSAVLRARKNFGKQWDVLSGADQEKVLSGILSEPDEKALIDSLVKDFGLEIENAKSVATCSLPDGYSRLSMKAITAILPFLEESVESYDKAALKAGYNHSNLYSGEWFDKLPYYGQVLERYTAGPLETSSNPDEARYGRIANPTVHIALNELRKVINGLIKKYGHPDQIVIEVARDLKLSNAKKSELAKFQNENTKKNQEYAKELEGLGLKNTYTNRQRFKLWEELGASPVDRRCPFTGERISIARLFSPEIEVEHLIPYSRCLDDSLSNKTLSARKANRDKGERTPFEAFGQSGGNYKWSEILDRADKLPPSKKARFSPEAAENFANADGWLARQLTDTAYISRVSRQYLSSICNPDNVWVVPGRLTSMLRYSLGMNQLLGQSAQIKERTDHRHHAIDAVVVGLTDRSMLQKVSRCSKQANDKGLAKLMEGFEPPWGDFLSSVKGQLERIVVSHKPDHGPEASLHNETAYGFVDEPDEKGVATVVHRVPLADLKKSELDKIRNLELVDEISQAARLIKKNRGDIDINVSKISEIKAADFKEVIGIVVKKSAIKRVKVFERLSVIPISDREGNVYKGYKPDGNYCYEIYRESSGKWNGNIISNFLANQNEYKLFSQDLKRYRSESYSGASLVMRLCKNDIVVCGNGSDKIILRVQRMSEGKLIFCGVNEANVDKRDRDKEDAFKFLVKSPNSLKKMCGRRAFVDSIGRLKDPGFNYAG